MRALEALALPALVRLAQATDEPLPTGSAAGRAARAASPAGSVPRSVTADGGVSHAELAQLAAGDAFALRALARAYRGPDAYYLNFYGPPGTFPSISAADLLVPEAGRLAARRACAAGWSSSAIRS